MKRRSLFFGPLPETLFARIVLSGAMQVSVETLRGFLIWGDFLIGRLFPEEKCLFLKLILCGLKTVDGKTVFLVALIRLRRLVEEFWPLMRMAGCGGVRPMM